MSEPKEQQYAPHGSGYWVGEDGLAYVRCRGCGSFSPGSGIGIPEILCGCRKCRPTTDGGEG